MSMSIIAKAEQIIRGICFVIYLATASTFLILENLFRPLYPKIDELTGYYFSENFKRGPPSHYIVHYWAVGLFQLFGINIVHEFRAEPPKDYKDNSIVMFTHGSNLDPLLIHATYPIFPHFVAKKSLFKIPIFGTALRSVGQIPIDRENLSSAITTLQSTANLASSEHKTIAIAPEGTRRRSPSFGSDQMLPFKKGPFHLSKAVGTDIIPCAIIGSHRLWPTGQIFPSAGTVIIKYLDRIPKEYVETKSIEEVQNEVKKRLTEELDEVSDDVIFSTENKPYKVFIVIMTVVAMFWMVLLRAFY